MLINTPIIQKPTAENAGQSSRHVSPLEPLNQYEGKVSPNSRTIGVNITIGIATPTTLTNKRILPLVINRRQAQIIPQNGKNQKCCNA